MKNNSMYFYYTKKNVELHICQIVVKHSVIKKKKKLSILECNYSSSISKLFK